MRSLQRPRRGIALLLSLIFIGCGSATPQPDAAVASEPAPAPVADDVLRAGLESPYVLRSGDGTAWLGVLVTPPADAVARPPLALALVVDTSGSMEGEKIEHARFAARTLIEALGPADEVALVAFASDVQVVRPRVALGQADVPALLATVDALSATSSTALHGGLVAGLKELEGAPPAAVRRLLLISDGQANVGPSTAEDILAALPPDGGATLSTLGVGTDYDEKVLTAVAERGRGGFHHLTDPVQLAGIVQAELDRARAVAGRGAVISVTPRPGVEILGASPGLSLQPQADGSVRIDLGDVHAGETRALAIQIRVPRGGEGEAADVALQYQPVGGGPAVARTATVAYRLTASPEEVTASAVPGYVVAADRARSAQILAEAAGLLRDGDLLEAQARLRDERARLQARRDALTGEERQAIEGLLALFADPYVDTDLDASSAPDPDAFSALLEAARQGQAVDAGRLGGLPAERLRLLRNAAYARHGYPFKSSDLQTFFAKTGWYREDRGFTPARLTRQDVANVATLKTWEQRAGLVVSATVRSGPAVSDADFEALVDQVRQGMPVAVGALDGLSLARLRVLRNAAYARHGYPFRAADLRAWFSARAWYRPDPAFTAADLTPEDAATIRVIKERERARLGGGAEAVRDFELRNRARAHQVVH
ncbi:MAG: YARHG domain-containing protein [Myxococcales bacterium]|nr:YARHG domain-containing protein [Myxococcales bacterium]